MNELFPQCDYTTSFSTDYASILKRVAEINPIQYSKTRNFIFGAVTYLSPYISRGFISIKQIQESVLAKGHQSATIEKFLQELAWREYFQRVWQVKGNDLFQDIKQPQDDVLHHQMINAIAKAQTGVAAIDNSIVKFYKTGYLHNHVRMYVASITCNIAKAHWSAPAQWMYYHLLDGDLASNTCSWQWVAGAFSSKKYYCTQENINRYTHTNQTNTFLNVPVEVLPKNQVPDILKQTIDLNLKIQLPTISTPHIDKTKPTLIYNSYNLDPLWRKDDDVNRVLLLEPSHFQRFPVSGNVIEFISALSKNIPNLQWMVGEVSDLVELCGNSDFSNNQYISKEHPAFTYYPGTKDARDWIYPEVKGYFNSFFSFWKKAEKSIIQDK